MNLSNVPFIKLSLMDFLTSKLAITIYIILLIGKNQTEVTAQG